MKSALIATLLAATAVAALASPTPSVFTYPDGSKGSSNLKQTGAGYPACDPGVEQWSGYFEVNATTNKNYFYWAFGPQSRRADAPVILWMTGGPGCSSSLALLVENGPCHINLVDGEMYNNPWAWNKDAYLIYIDQPAGVGFSYSDKAGYDHNEKEVGEDMYQFLQAFYTAHNTIRKNDLFIVGESYGGHFAPATAHQVWANNKAGNKGPRINIQGLAVGNGLTVPSVQYEAYVPFVDGYCKEKIGHTCVSQASIESMNSTLPSCIALINQCSATKDPAVCSQATQLCNGGQMGPYEQTGLNVYDITKPCIGQLCYNFSAPVAFMNRADVQIALGVKPQVWEDCNMEVNGMFGVDWFQTLGGDVAEMLNSGEVRVMIYAGDLDFIVNWIGNQAWTKDLTWAQKAAFNAAPNRQYSLKNGQPAADIRSVAGSTFASQFSFIRVFNGGHMVPMDQPEAIFEILTTWVQNKNWF